MAHDRTNDTVQPSPDRATDTGASRAGDEPADEPDGDQADAASTPDSGPAASKRAADYEPL